MISVSQNMTLGTPVVPFGAAEAMTDGGMKAGDMKGGATPDGTEFLQVFAAGNAAPILADDTNPGLKSNQPLKPDAPDAPDKEISAETALVVGAIWQPVAQTIAQLPKSDARAAVIPAKFETEVTPASDNEGQRPLSTKAQPDNGATPPQQMAEAAVPSVTSVAPPVAATAATATAIFSPEAEIQKPLADPAPLPAAASGGGNAANAPESQPPALTRAVTPDSDESLPKNTTPGAQHRPEATFSKLADVSTTPTEPPKDPHPDPQIPAYGQDISVRKTRSDPPVSAAQTAWLQKWVGDVATPKGSGTLAGAQPNMADQTGDASATAVVAAPAAALTDAVTKLIAEPGDTAVRKNGDFTPAAKQAAVSAAKGTIQPAVPASSLDHPTQFTDSLPDPASFFDAANFLTTSAAMTQPVASSLSLSPNPVLPVMPAAVSPTIVDMTKSGNDGPVELALSPEELGRLTISIRHDGDFVRVTVIADRPETLDLMRRHGGDLLADLRQAGFSGASLNFGQGGQPRFANPQAATKSEPLQHLPPETKPTAPSRSRKGSGVDLRF